MTHPRTTGAPPPWPREPPVRPPIWTTRASPAETHPTTGAAHPMSTIQEAEGSQREARSTPEARPPHAHPQSPHLPGPSPHEQLRARRDRAPPQPPRHRRLTEHLRAQSPLRRPPGHTSRRSRGGRPRRPPSVEVERGALQAAPPKALPAAPPQLPPSPPRHLSPSSQATPALAPSAHARSTLRDRSADRAPRPIAAHAAPASTARAPRARARRVGCSPGDPSTHRL